MLCLQLHIIRFPDLASLLSNSAGTEIKDVESLGTNPMKNMSHDERVERWEIAWTFHIEYVSKHTWQYVFCVLWKSSHRYVFVMRSCWKEIWKTKLHSNFHMVTRNKGCLILIFLILNDWMIGGTCSTNLDVTRWYKGLPTFQTSLIWIDYQHLVM